MVLLLTLASHSASCRQLARDGDRDGVKMMIAVVCNGHTGPLG